MSHPVDHGYLGANSHLGQHGSAEARDLAEIEVPRPRDQRHAQSLDDSMSQPCFIAQIATGTDWNHPAEKFRQREGDAARRPSATREPRQISAIRINGMPLTHIIQNIQDDPDSLGHRGVVACVVRTGERNSLLLTQSLQLGPSGGLLTGRNKHNQRQPVTHRLGFPQLGGRLRGRFASPLRRRRDVQFVPLLSRIIPLEPLRRSFRQTLIRHGEDPIQPGRLADGHLFLIARFCGLNRTADQR